MPGGPEFRRGQIFPEMNEDLLNIFIFRGDVFKKPFRTGEKLSFLFTQIAFVSYNMFIKPIKRVTILFLKQMLPKSMFKMPFCIEKSSNI